MSEYAYRPGTILLLETGEYSDFGYEAQLVTLCDLDLRDAIERYKSQFIAKDEWDEADPCGFVGWLCATQQCAQLECQTAHIGSYGRLEL